MSSILQGGSIAVGTVIGGPAGGAFAGTVAGVFGGSRARAGGVDPCGFCGGVETFRGVLVKNAGQGGAPADFRNLPPCPDASIPCGGGVDVPGLGKASSFANKDDALDCVPQPGSVGSYWKLDPCTQTWNDVSPAAVKPAVNVAPTFGATRTSPETAERSAVEAGIFNLPAVNPMILLVVVGGAVALAFVFGQRVT